MAMWLCGYVDKSQKKQKKHFMFFDRYEIHIQAFVDFINGKLIIFRSSSPQNYFEDIYIYIYIQKINIYKIYTNIYIYISKK